MICILAIDDGKEITGWIIATDFRDAFQKANAMALGCGSESTQFLLAEWLAKQVRKVPEVGKWTLPSGHVMLVT